ncbi:MAG TPA: HNH endonuclease signature motif containing protein, partial [Propionibacteriaceae bacterium]|nr:HNH endonuclease signature motif containing protein [Propionibacteriaceae bacterium]
MSWDVTATEWVDGPGEVEVFEVVEVAARFWAKVDRSGGPDACWPWTANRMDSGYGRYSIDGRSKLAHRISYELSVGSIPDGLQIDHLCRNKPCVNPTHLEAVTQRENLLRGDTVPARNAARTHCANGHEFTPENTSRNRS